MNMTAAGSPVASGDLPLEAVDSVRISVGLEEGADGFAIVHALDIPGCLAHGESVDSALASFPPILYRWLTLLESEGEPVAHRDCELDITVDEWIRIDGDLSATESVVCFEADRRPLGDEDLFRGLRVLGALRGRLLPLIRRGSGADLDLQDSSGRPIRVILEELARAQWWTLTRLGASPLAEVPAETTARLDTAMALVVRQLTELPHAGKQGVIQLDGEEWAARKVIRRLLWLEWSLGAAVIEAIRQQRPPS